MENNCKDNSITLSGSITTNSSMGPSYIYNNSTTTYRVIKAQLFSPFAASGNGQRTAWASCGGSEQLGFTTASTSPSYSEMNFTCTNVPLRLNVTSNTNQAYSYTYTIVPNNASTTDERCTIPNYEYSLIPIFTIIAFLVFFIMLYIFNFRNAWGRQQ